MASRRDITRIEDYDAMILPSGKTPQAAAALAKGAVGGGLWIFAGQFLRAIYPDTMSQYLKEYENDSRDSDSKFSVL